MMIKWVYEYTNVHTDRTKIIQDSAPRDIFVKVYRITHPKTGVTPVQL